MGLNYQLVEGFEQGCLAVVKINHDMNENQFACILKKIGKLAS